MKSEDLKLEIKEEKQEYFEFGSKYNIKVEESQDIKTDIKAVWSGGPSRLPVK